MKILRDAIDIIKFCKENNFKYSFSNNHIQLFTPNNYKEYKGGGVGEPVKIRQSKKGIITIKTYKITVSGKLNMKREIVEKWNEDKVAAIYISATGNWVVIQKLFDNPSSKSENWISLYDVEGVLDQYARNNH